MLSSHPPPPGFYDTQFALEKLRVKWHGVEDQSKSKLKEYNELVSEDQSGSFKDLPVACFLALAMVRKPGDVAAVFLQTSPKEIFFHVSKNKLKGDDQEHAHRLMEIMKEFGRSTIPHEFEKKFLEQIIKKCRQKLERTVEKLKDAEFAKAYKTIVEWVATKDRSNTVKIWISDEANRGERRSADKDLRTTAKSFDVDILTAALRTFEVIDMNINRMLEASEVFFSVSACCHILGSSMICRNLLDAALKPAQAEKVAQGLIRLGRYSRGCARLKKELAKCYPRQFPRISPRFVPSKEETHHWDTSAYDVVARVWRKGQGYTRIPVTTQSHLKIIVKDLKWNQSSRFTQHAEIGLIMHLRNLGIKGGEIGVSKSCCRTCWENITTLKSHEKENWSVYDHHGSIYCTLPTGIKALDQNLLDKMESSLLQVISAALVTIRGPESVGVPSDRESASERSESPSADSVGPAIVALYYRFQTDLPQPPAIPESLRPATPSRASRSRPSQPQLHTTRSQQFGRGRYVRGGSQGARRGERR